MEDRGTIPMQAVTSMVGATVVADDVSRTPKSGETMQLSDSELENDYCGPAHYLKEEVSMYRRSPSCI